MGNMHCQLVFKLSFVKHFLIIKMFLLVLIKNNSCIGLVNYCVPAGEAYLKALDVARDINKNVSIFICFEL